MKQKRVHCLENTVNRLKCLKMFACEMLLGLQFRLQPLDVAEMSVIVKAMKAIEMSFDR